MRIWLHGRIDVAPRITKRADGTFLIENGVFSYRRWQLFVSRRFPRLFPTYGLWFPVNGGDARICGLTVKQVVRRCGFTESSDVR